jgi:hypothetical protein
MERIKVSYDLLPRDMLLGIATGRGFTFCEACNDVHEFYVVQLGFFFFTVNVMWYL